MLLSESDQLISYDSATNQFYETEPDSSIIKVIKVKKIDAETLEKYTVEELSK